MSDAGYANKHRWTAFVRCKDPEYQQKMQRIIKKVRFVLCEGFANRYRNIEPKIGQPCEITYNGYDTFELGIEIHWKNEWN